MTFKIKNTGNQEGQVSLGLKVMDVLDQTRQEWLKAGEDKEISFAFQLPEDIEEKDYFAEYTLNPTLTPTLSLKAREDIVKGKVKFHVAGVNISVSASLDKQSYALGETARLSIVVSGQGPGASNLFARVNYNGYEEQKAFTTGQGQAQPLQFDVPLTQITGEKLFYGIYHQSGRSIHLNSLYIYKSGDAISISTDKQVYNPGEAITAVVSGQGAGASGEMTLTGPGNYSETFAFSGSATKSITLPLVMTAGTYQISGQLSVAGGQVYTASHPIDVNGIQVKVKEATLDKAKYAATDTMSLTLNIESNKDMAATLKTWIVDPTGKYTPTGETPVPLTSSEPLLLTSHVSLLTSSMGIHRLVYGIYADGQTQGSAPTLLLSSGSEAFDVGDAVLLGITTDKVDYPTITEPVNVTFSLYGSTTATMEIYVDGQSVKTEAVALSGFTTKAVSFEPAVFSPGSHTVKVVLTAGGLTSIKESSIVYGSNLPDLTINVGAYGNTPAGSGMMQITATVMNQGKTASGATDVAFYDGDPVGAYNNTPLQTIPLPPLAPGESTTVTFNWNVMGKAGKHTIYAVADASKAVAEFNETNNTASVRIEVSALILSVTTTSNAYEANHDVGIAEMITNLTGGTTYNDASLSTTIKDPIGAIHALPLQTITAAPGESSYANSWNTASNKPGSYTVTAEVSATGQPPMQASTAFEILPSISAYGNITLSSNEVIQGFPMDINYTLTNNGNVDITNGELKVELKGKATGTSSTLTTITLDYLAVLATRSISIAIEKVDVEPGEYTVTLILRVGDKTINIASKDLTVKPPLKVIKSISTLPRVLVWTKPVVSGQGAVVSAEPTTNEKLAIDALTRLGAYYNVVHSESEFMEGMRSGYYSTYALLETGKPTTDGLTSELVERVYGGDTLILTGSSNMDDIKVSEATGTKFTGYLGEGVRMTTINVPLYEQPVSVTTAGKVQKVSVTSDKAEVWGDILETGASYPSIVTNRYGSGNGTLMTFDLGKAAEWANDMDTYSALFGRVITVTAPSQIKLIPEAVLPVEIAVESLGSAFDLKIVEKIDSRLTLLDATLNGYIDRPNGSVAWETHLNENQTQRPMYIAELPQFRGSYGSNAEVYYRSMGEYHLYNTYALSLELTEDTADIQNRMQNAISLLTVPKERSGTRDSIVKRYQTLVSRSSFTRKDIDKDIHDLLKIMDDLKKLSVDTGGIRAGLDELLAILQRGWALAR